MNFLFKLNKMNYVNIPNICFLKIKSKGNIAQIIKLIYIINEKNNRKKEVDEGIEENGFDIYKIDKNMQSMRRILTIDRYS